MATVTKPFTFTAGTTILSAQVNSNFDTLYNDYNGNILDANIGASAAIAWSKISKTGAKTGDIGCRAYNSGNLSIANNTLTVLTLDSERWDTDTMHSTVSNTSRITFNTAGKYVITASVLWAANATGERLISIFFNNTTTIGGFNIFTPDGTIQHHQSVATIYTAAVSDYAEIQVRQGSGGALNVLASSNTSPEFSAQLISAQSLV